jgi:hypothetical protein
VTERRHSAAGAIWSATDPGFLRRVRKTAIVLGIGVAAPIATYQGLVPAAGWLLGVGWSVVNLAATESIARLVLTLEPRSKAQIARRLAVKFGLLYGVAVVLLALLHVPALWWAAGFTWPLFVAIMKAVGRTYLGLDAVPGLSGAPRRMS